MDLPEAFYRIAGLAVSMSSFGRTVEQARPYLAEGPEGPADIAISTDWRTFQRERAPHLSDGDCEYLCTGASFARQLLPFDGLVLHSSAVVLDGRAYLFSAPCGTGKSTHTSLWLREFADRGAYILNDDKPALRLEEGDWFAYGTPWSGKHDVSVNARVPVAGICFLRQAPGNSIARFTGPKAVHALLGQTMRPADAASRAKVLELADSLMTEVPVWQMGCNMDPEAARVSYGAMSGANEESER